MGIWQAVWLICLAGFVVGSRAVWGKRSRQLLLNDDPGKTTTPSPDDRGELPSEIPCAYRNQCGRYARLPFHARNCFCDLSCRAYGDCCRDFSPAVAPQGPPGADKAPVIPNSIRGIISCRRVEEIDTSFEMYIVDSCPKGYNDRFIVEKCQNELTPGLFYRLPVTGRTTGVLYRNVYCATCAGDLDIVYWEMAYRCPEVDWLSNGTLRKIETAEEFRRLTNHLRCPVEMIPPMRKRPRKCKSNIDRCPRKWRDERVATKCKSYTAYVYHGLQVFKNKHCAICNNIDEAIVQCDDTRTPWPDFERSRQDEGGEEEAAEQEDVTPSSVYVVLDTNTGSGILRRTAESVAGREQGERRSGDTVVVELGQCSEGNVYDAFADTCRYLGCRDGKCYLTGGNLTSTVSPGTFDTAEIETEKATTVKTTGMPASTIAVTSPKITSIPRPTFSIRNRSTSPEFKRDFKTSSTTAKARTTYNKMAKDHRSIAVTKTTTIRDKTLKSRSRTTSRSNTPRRTVSTKMVATATIPAIVVVPSTANSTTVAVPTTAISSSTAATSSVSTSAATFTTPTTTTTVTPSHTTLTTAVSTNTVTMPPRESFVLVIPVSTVGISPLIHTEITDNDDFVKVTRSARGQLMEINPKNVKLVAPSSSPTTPRINAAGTTVVLKLSKTYGENLEGEMELSDVDPEDGKPDSDKSRNCSDVLVMFQFDRLQSLASFVGTLTSLVSLLVSFVAIVVLPSIRGTVRGKVLLSLILSLIAAQLLYLVALPSNQPFPDREVCYWFGTVMHYCVLAVFFWVSVLAIDMAMHIMGNRRELEACESWGRVFGYSLYAWMTPAVIVAACLTAEALEADQFLIRPCYGQGVCWVTGRFALLLAVALPAGVLTLVSLFLFFLSASHMCVNVTYKDLKTKKNRIPDCRRLTLCICLTLVVALTWVSGFVATFTRRNSIWWVFIGLSSFQGSFICVAFVCTRKVFQRLKERGQNGGGGGKGSASTNWSYQKDRGPSSTADRTTAKHLVPGEDNEIVLHETSM